MVESIVASFVVTLILFIFGGFGAYVMMKISGILFEQFGDYGPIVFYGLLTWIMALLVYLSLI